MYEGNILLPEVLVVKSEALPDYILERAYKVVRNTQGESWDDPEDWQGDAVELAHAVVRFLEGGQ